MTGIVPVRKSTGISTACEIMELQVPSNRWSTMGGTTIVGILWLSTNAVSMKQCKEPESMRVQTGRESEGIVRVT
jgi:hypothetical protein